MVDKLERQDATKRVEEEVLEALVRRPRRARDYAERRAPVQLAFDKLEKDIIRKRIAVDKKRPDGRAAEEIRDIWIEVGVAPRTHGSAIFTRGQTQAFSVAALGTTRDEMRLDTLGLQETKHYFHHYNFPPFSVGEAGFMRGPKRRDIGHGALAERALVPVVPTVDEFPYTIRVVSDILESNGSSLDGLGLRLVAVADGRRRADQGAGGRRGDGPDQGGRRLHRPHRHRGRGGPPRRHGLQGRRHLRGHHRPADGHQDHGRDVRHPARRARAGQERAPDDPRQDERGDLRAARASCRSTRRASRAIQIDTEKIGAVIGKGGETIRALSEEFDAQIDIDDDGTVRIYAQTGEQGDALIDRIRSMTKEVEVGDEFTGKVVKTTTFGAFIELAKGTDGLLHISNIKPGERVNTVEDVRQPRRRARASRWSRSTASAAASACAWPRTRRSRASRPRSWPSMGTGDKGPRGDAAATAATAADRGTAAARPRPRPRRDRDRDEPATAQRVSDGARTARPRSTRASGS